MAPYTVSINGFRLGHPDFLLVFQNNYRLARMVYEIYNDVFLLNGHDVIVIYPLGGVSCRIE